MIAEDGYIVEGNDYSILEKINEVWNEHDIYPKQPNHSTKKSRNRRAENTLQRQRQHLARQAKTSLKNTHKTTQQ